MAVPVLVAVATFVAGYLAAARWLPQLSPDRVGVLAFATVCVLLGAVLAIVGIEIYQTVRVINRATELGGTTKADLLSDGIMSILRDAGPVLGLAAAVYLLAPAAAADEPAAAADEPPAGG